MNTWTPLLVAALTASNSLSYVGSKVSVNAESRMRPRTCTPMSTFRTSSFCKTSGTVKLLYLLPKSNRLTYGVAGIRGVMRGTVVQAETGGETDPCLQTVFLDQSTHTVFDSIRNLGHCHPRANKLARVFSSKTMHFATTPNILICKIWIFHGQFLEMALLLGCSSPSITRAD